MELSVPFHGAYTRMDGAHWVTARVSGILRCEPDGLVLQAREQRQAFAVAAPGATGGLTGDDATFTTRIPFEELAELEFRPGLALAPRLVLTVRRLELLDAFRWADGARLSLSVRRRDRAAARELALVVSTALIDRDLARLEGNTQPASLPPDQTGTSGQ